MDNDYLQILETGRITLGKCPKCKNETKRVWGFITSKNLTNAGYFLEWAPGCQDQFIFFDFIVGKWGKDATVLDKSAVSLNYSNTEHAFMVVNAKGRVNDDKKLVSKTLSRSEVIKTPLADEVFLYADLLLSYYTSELN